MQTNYTSKDRKRFWKKVEIRGNDECWLWKSCKNSHGYGRFGVGMKVYLAHRISYEMTFGEIPEGLLGLHKCDNPSCVNPNHIFLGTQEDNMHDAIRKGRSVLVIGNYHGEEHPMCKLSDKQVAEIRERFSSEKITKASLAREFDVHPKQIYNIVNYKQRT